MSVIDIFAEPAAKDSSARQSAVSYNSSSGTSAGTYASSSGICVGAYVSSGGVCVGAYVSVLTVSGDELPAVAAGASASRLPQPAARAAMMSEPVSTVTILFFIFFSSLAVCRRPGLCFVRPGRLSFSLSPFFPQKNG